MTEFVEVVVEATGKSQMVPADWLDDPVLGKGIAKVEPTAAPAAPPETGASNPDVQTVFGEADTEPIRPAYRSDYVDPDAQPDLEIPTERDTHAVIDHFALEHSIDLSDVVDGTKAEKLAVIDQALNPGDTESPDETPANGDEEN